MLSSCPLRPCAAQHRQRTAAIVPPRPRGRRSVAAAAGGPAGGKNDAERAKFEELVSKQLGQLKASGMSQQQARKTLQTWADMGARDEAEVRKLLVSRSLKPVSTLALQLGLDALCAAGAFTLGSGAGQSGPPFGLALQVISYFGGFWYAIQALAEAGALGAIVLAARRYQTDSDAILAAVQQLAGPSSGIGLVDSTKLAVNTLKVIGVLQGISDDLKSLSSSGKLEPSTLRNLSAYLVLQSAKDKFGFDAARYGLSDGQAANIAAVFAEFDANDDGRLELSELRRLCDLVGRRLSDDELREALALLGGRGEQYLYFNDFAEWYLGLKPASSTAA